MRQRVILSIQKLVAIAVSSCQKLEHLVHRPSLHLSPLPIEIILLPQHLVIMSNPSQIFRNSILIHLDGFQLRENQRKTSICNWGILHVVLSWCALVSYNFVQQIFAAPNEVRILKLPNLILTTVAMPITVLVHGPIINILNLVPPIHVQLSNKTCKIVVFEIVGQNEFHKILTVENLESFTIIIPSNVFLIGLVIDHGPNLHHKCWPSFWPRLLFPAFIVIVTCVCLYLRLLLFGKFLVYLGNIQWFVVARQHRFR